DEAPRDTGPSGGPWWTGHARVAPRSRRLPHPHRRTTCGSARPRGLRPLAGARRGTTRPAPGRGPRRDLAAGRGRMGGRRARGGHRCPLGPGALHGQGGHVQGVVPPDQAVAGLRRCAHHPDHHRQRRPLGRGHPPIEDPRRPRGRRRGSGSSRTAWPVGGPGRLCGVSGRGATDRGRYRGPVTPRRPDSRPAPAPGLVVVDKPGGMTSHDVVGRLRRYFGTRKVGHAGTLDPMATGVLVVGIERATKMLGLLALETKSYEATIRLGQTTTTDDAEGETTASSDASAVTDEAIGAAVAGLTGTLEQVPSSVSAIKVDGRRAYDRVRAGEEVELRARQVTVSRFDVVERRSVGTAVALVVVVDCSTGTYIRALARDLGGELGVGGHLTALRRTSVGPFGLDVARTLPELEAGPRLS